MVDKENRKPGIELDAIDLNSLSFLKTEMKKEGPAEQIVPLAETTPSSIKSEEIHKDIKILALPSKRRAWLLGGVILALIGGGVYALWFLGLFEYLFSDGQQPSSDVRHAIQVFAENTKKMSSLVADMEEGSKEINSKIKISQLLAVVNSINAQLPEYEYRRNEYSRNVRKNHSRLVETGHSDLVAAATFLEHAPSIQYIEILKEYLASLERYLTYFYINFDEVRQRRQPQMESYEKLYLEYKRFQNKYEQIRSLEKQAAGRLLETYPQARGLFLHLGEPAQKPNAHN